MQNIDCHFLISIYIKSGTVVTTHLRGAIILAIFSNSLNFNHKRAGPHLRQVITVLYFNLRTTVSRRSANVNIFKVNEEQILKIVKENLLPSERKG